MTQGQMFPMTEEERIAILRGNLASDVEKRLAKRDAAAVALADAQEAEDGARGLLSVFDSMVRERDRAHAAAATAVDPITGEVTSIPVAGWECPTCWGHGRLPDKTGGGHHKCKVCNGSGHAEPSCDNCTGYGDCNISQRPGSDTMGCGGKTWIHGEMMGELPIGDENTSAGEAADIIDEVPPANPPADRLPVNAVVVIALHPGSDEPHVTKIGEHTRYGELVADYLTAAGLTGKHNAADWTVLAEDELTTTGGLRKLRDVITAADYGKRLLVVAADQGSVTGVPAEEGAS